MGGLWPVSARKAISRWRRGRSSDARRTAMLRQVLDSVSDVVFAVDGDGRVIYANARFEELLGERPLGTPLAEWLAGCELFRADRSKPVPLHGLASSRALRGEPSPRMAVILKTPRAPEGRFLRVQSQAVHGPDGGVLAVVTIIQDRTRRMAQGRKLREKDQRLRAALAAGGMGTYRWDVETGAVNWDESLLRLFDMTEQPRTSQEVFEHVHPDDRLHMQEAIKRCLSGESDFRAEYRVIRRDGGVRWLASRGRLVREPGKRVFLAGAAMDITERVRGEKRLRSAVEQLTRSNRDLDDFSRIAAHDLQEPLRRIGNFAELVGSRYSGCVDEQGRRFLAYIVDGVRWMGTLITDLREYSRADIDYRLRPMRLEDALRDALDTLELPLGEAGGMVCFGATGAVCADRGRLAQLFRNLIANAVKFRGPEAPRIDVSARQEKDLCVVTVRDNGIGIDARYFDQLFRPFKRLHGRDAYPGSGIGLAVCKKIVERHGGTIWVEPASGKGAAFSFSLPRA